MYNFIVNAKSGKGNGKEALKKVIDLCYSKSVDYSIHITNGVGHATILANELSKNCDNTIVAVGGDGTFHEVLNGVVSPKTTKLGFIPSGRGNDYARAACLSTNPVQAFNDILKGEEIFTDYFNVDKLRCLNVAGTGLDIDVLEKVANDTGKITYILSLIYCLQHFEPYHITTILNGVSTDYDCIMVGVCNGIAIGGNLRLSPLSKINDGKLNVVVISMPKSKKILPILPKFARGKHINMPFTTHFLCDEIKIDTHGRKIQLDGEIYSNLNFNCKIVAGGLKTFKPSGFSL